MISRKLKSVLIGVLVVGLAAGLALVFLEARFQGQQEEGTPSDVRVVQHSLYAQLTREEMIDQADVIFVGKVVGISPTQWNQDSGEVWVGGLQLHYIELETLEPIVDTIGLGEHVTLTALGRSPLEARADHALKEGDQAVIFARQKELVWRDGRRPVIKLMGNPSDAHFILGDDGLYHGRWNEGPVSFEQLLNRIAPRREILVQP